MRSIHHAKTPLALAAAVASALAVSCGDSPQGFTPWPDQAEFYVGSTSDDTALAFSPSGEVLLFTSATSGNPGFYGYSGVGNPSLRVFASWDESTGPTGCWCDTTYTGEGRIVYTATKDDSTTELRWIPGNETTVHLILYDSLPHRFATWTPMADSVLYCTLLDGRWGLWKVDLEAQEPQPFHLPDADCLRPSYSPDGEWILYQCDLMGDWDIWAIRPDGTQPRMLAGGTGDDIHPTWGPEGGWYAFSSERTGNFEIWLGNVHSDTLIQLTDDPGTDLYPAWNPGYGWIGFSSDRVEEGLFDIFWIDAPTDPDLF
jgi:TolB protein